MQRVIRWIRMLFGWEPHKCPERIRPVCMQAALTSRDLIIDAGVTPMRDASRPWTVKARAGEFIRNGIWHWRLPSGKAVFGVTVGGTITVAHKPGHLADVSLSALQHEFGHYWTKSERHDPRLGGVLPYWG